MGDGVAIDDGARVHARGGVLRIDAGAVLGEHASLADTAHVGAECVVGPWARMEGDARIGCAHGSPRTRVLLRGARGSRRAGSSPPTRSVERAPRRLS